MDSSQDHDWVIDGMHPPSPPQPSRPKPKPKPKPKPPALQTKKTPPLPPRRATNQSDTSFLYPPLVGMDSASQKKGNHAQASSVSSFHSVSLSSDTDPGSPGSLSSLIPTYPIDSTDSFERISPPPLPLRPNLPYVPRRAPPPPPSRASDRSSIQSLTTTSSSSQSNRSSVQTPTLALSLPLPVPSTPSTISTPIAPTASIQRPTPVPSAAQKRYRTVFIQNLIQRRKAEIIIKRNCPPLLSHTEAKRTRRQAAGWRGLSVDLITATPEELLMDQGKGKDVQVDEYVGPDERLEGAIVKAIWTRSRIDKTKLSEIWNECDPDGTGSLDMESFIRGMWRIDEHLRRAQRQTSALRNANSTSLTSLRSGLGSLRIKQPQSSRSSTLSRSTSKSSLSQYHQHQPHHLLNYGYSTPPPVPRIVLR